MDSAVSVPRPAQAYERWFFTGMALALTGAMALGFARTFFLRAWFPESVANAPPEPFFLVHGAVFTAWFVLLVAQASLVATRRIDLHRKLGAVGVMLAVAMVVLGIVAAITAARRAGGFMGIPAPAVQFLAIPLVDMLAFALFVALAIAQRRNPQAHKRLMLLASISIIAAAVARWPIDFINGTSGGGPLAFFGVTDLFLLPIVVWDFATRGKLHAVTLWGGLLLIASQPLRLVLSGTEAWARFAGWLIG